MFKVILRIIYYYTKDFARLAPRDKHKWVFGSATGFGDNPKYLFIQMQERHPEVRVIWVSKSKDVLKDLSGRGCEAYYWLSLKGMYHVLTAKVIVSDHSVGNINQFLSGGAFFVNLWHGSSVKRVRWQAPELFMRQYNLKSVEEMRTSLWFRINTFNVMFRTADLCLAPSTIQAKEFFAPMMNIPLEQVIVAVYPRSQFLIAGKTAAKDFIKKHEGKDTLDFVEQLESYNKVYIYMPTWRNDDCDFISQAAFDWEKLNNLMESRNELFILKFHPFTKLNAGEITQYKNLRLYPTRCDLYAVLPFVDCLITDYSSIYTDFLTMNKEIILYVFDYDEYVKNSYELSEYDKYFSGKRAYDFNQLLQIIESGEDCHVPQEKYSELMDFFWDNNESTTDIVEEVKHRIGL